MTSTTASRPAAAPAPARQPARRRRRLHSPEWAGLLYIAPALAVFAVFVLYPVFRTAQTSLYAYDGLTPATWVGLANYREVFGAPDLRQALVHSLVLLVFYAALPVLLGLALAGLMSRVRIYGLTAFRALLFVPQVLSSVVVAVAWRGIYDIDGPLNAALRAVGLASLARPWLGDFGTALPAVGVVGTWVEYGLCMVLFLAGIATIGREQYEAARLDGAGPFREFFSITLPSLRPQVSIALVLTITFALRNFDLVWNTTRGGPGTSTTVPSLFVYRHAFQDREVGLASSLAVVLTVVILVVVALVLWALRERDERAAR